MNVLGTDLVRHSSILYAYGMALAGVAVDLSEPFVQEFSKDSMPEVESRALVICGPERSSSSRPRASQRRCPTTATSAFSTKVPTRP
jgi:hypothetical protein